MCSRRRFRRRLDRPGGEAMPEWLNDWGKRFWAGFIEVWTAKITIDIGDKWTAWLGSLWHSVTFESIVGLFDAFSADVASNYQDNKALLAKLLSWELETVTGLDIPEASLLKSIDGIAEPDERVDLG